MKESEKGMEEELKRQGNEAFQASNFLKAEELYLEALRMNGNSHILWTNLAAAYLEQQKFDKAIDAADQAISIQPSWTKAYYRKAVAFESLENFRDSFRTWNVALKCCEQTPWLKKQFEKSKIDWMKRFRSFPVESHQDLLERYQLLTDSREKLSTLAHFWNLSSPEERLKHFVYFLNMIGGKNSVAESLDITVEMMLPMPMHNYQDLSHERIQSWCDFFSSIDSGTKTLILEQQWNLLTSKEQNDVVLDLQLFISQARLLTESNPIS